MKSLILPALFCLIPAYAFSQHTIIDKCKPDTKSSMKIVNQDNKLIVRSQGDSKYEIEVDGKLLSHSARVEQGSYLVLSTISSPGTSIRLEEVHVFALCAGLVKQVFYCVSDSQENLPGGFKYKIGLKFASNDHIQITQARNSKSRKSIDLTFNERSCSFAPNGSTSNEFDIDLFGQKVIFKNGKWDYKFAN